MLVATKLTPERRLQRTVIGLLRNPKIALLSGVLMVGKTYIEDSNLTARTNGRDEWYGKAFVESLNDRELAFLKMHETGHKMYRHLTTWRKLHDEDHSLANAACDYVINLMLRDLDPTESFMAMPQRDGKVLGLIDERFRGMNAKQVFDILKQEKEEKRRGHGDQPGDSGGGDMDEHDWEGASGLSEQEQEELAKEIDQALRQGLINDAKINGKDAGGLARQIGELVKPKVDWREQLREFVRSYCAAREKSSWRRVNRRLISSGVYMPSLIGEQMKHLVIAIDTSGSIGGAYLTAFLSEVAGICADVNPEVIDLLYWDHAVAGHETYTNDTVDNIVRSTKPRGGGGTSPSCITQYLKDKRLEAECVVVLTDGYVGTDWGGAWPCPVLWCIAGNPQTTSPIGKTIHIEL
jgi:predicted metal-dependent peptidase